ncbi:MAG: flagellar hook-associated protein FlgK [Deltaproteobacteria bacterium]|nr:flagellar hook-associated protein FlgK [Deltaproteobacteria bacterium]
MASLTSVLDIAKTALLANQKAINVTSHNIANANTEGYTRQKAVLEPMTAVRYGGLYFGTGVTINSIERVFDRFQGVQIRTATSTLSRYETKGEHLSALEALVNDLDGAGLSSRIDDFFNSFQEIINNPSSYPERSSLLSSASLLTDAFNTIDATIRQNLSSLNKEMESVVKEINSIAEQVAELNNQISGIEVGGMQANDLRDQRDLLLEDLSGMVEISTIESETGQTDVYIGGFFLVTGITSAPLELEINPESPVYDIVSRGTVLNDRITGGSLKGHLEGAAIYDEAEDKLNLLAASLIKEVNLQHSQGYGLDGTTGTDFFAAPAVYTHASSGNAGGAVVANGAVTDYSQLTLNDYEVRFSSASSYTIVNTDTSAVVTQGAYTSGSAITFEGLSFTISDNTGAPAAGDKFEISVKKNAAELIDVAVTDPNAIAASSTLAGVPGDNLNAMALADLKGAALIEGATFNDYYNRIVSDVGFVSSEASGSYDAQSKLVEELKSARESVSGVSIEEEAINLIKLQRAYEAAAKVMATADSMLETLLNLR